MLVVIPALEFSSTIHPPQLPSLSPPGLWVAVSAGPVRGRVAELWTVVGFLASPATDLEGQVARAVADARERLGEEVEVLVVGIRQALQDGRVVAPEWLMCASSSPSTFLLHSASLRPAACTVATGALAVALPSTGCSTCNLALGSAAALAEHRETSQHKRNEEFLEVRPSLGLARRHPLGLEVTLVPGDARVAGGPPEAVVVDSHPGERVSFSLQLFNFRPSEVGEEWRGVVVARVAAPSWQDVLVVTDEHGVTREGEETRVRLRHGRRYRVTVTCSTRDVGEHRIPVVISFYHDLHSELAAGGEDRQLTLLGVEVVVRATTPELLAMLPTQPFQPPAREEPWRARETVRGLSPAPTFAKDFLVTRLPLGDYPITEARVRAFASSFQGGGGESAAELEELEADRRLLEAKLEPRNYRARLELLLHLEQWAQEREARRADLRRVEVRVERSSGLVVVEVVGVAATLSTMRGDKLYLRRAGDPAVEYEGFVHRVSSRRAETLKFWLSLAPKFIFFFRWRAARCGWARTKGW